MVTGILLAGGRIQGARAELAPGGVKALIRMRRVEHRAGKKGEGAESEDITLLEIAIRAISEVHGISRIRAVGPLSIEQICKNRGAEFLEEGDTGPTNLHIGIRDLPEGTPLVVMATDLPFVTGTAVEAFLEAVPTLPSIAFPVLTRAEMESRYPGAVRKYVKLRDGDYTLGSILSSDRKSLMKNIPLFQDAFKTRKSPIKMAAFLGAGLALKFIIGTASMRDIEKRAEQLLGCPAEGVRVNVPELAIDIDQVGDLQYFTSFKRES